MNEQIIQDITVFCREAGLAESTFGRRAVNDGKLTARLRNGGRVTTETVDRIHAFMSNWRETARASGGTPAPRAGAAVASMPAPAAPIPAIRSPGGPPSASGPEDPQRNFRF